jgi:N-methylhydantoinase A
VAFGGGGPVHAAALAQETGIGETLIPPSPGVTSGLGLLLANGKHDRVKTVLLPVGSDRASRDLCAGELSRVFAELRGRITAELPDAGEMEVSYDVEVRYRRQGHELTVPVTTDVLDAERVDALVARFHHAHRDRFGYAPEGEALVIVNAIVTITQAALEIGLQPGGESRAGAGRTSRPVFFDGEWHDATILARDDFGVGECLAGPAIIEQLDSTTVVPPQASVTKDEMENLIVRIDG